MYIFLKMLKYPWQRHLRQFVLYVFGVRCTVAYFCLNELAEVQSGARYETQSFFFYVSVDGNCCADTLSSLSLSCSIWLIYSRCQCKFSNLSLVKFYTNEDLWAQTINKPGILKIMQNEENTGTNSFVSRHLYGIYIL